MIFKKIGNMENVEVICHYFRQLFSIKQVLYLQKNFYRSEYPSKLLPKKHVHDEDIQKEDLILIEEKQGQCESLPKEMQLETRETANDLNGIDNIEGQVLGRSGGRQ